MANGINEEIVREVTRDRKRQTAFKFRISALNNVEIPEMEHFNFLEIRGKKVSRVNIIANVIEKFIRDDSRYGAITVDDASSQIRVKFFGEDIKKLNGVEIGDTIRIIGTLKYFNQELYIMPEILKKVDSKWLLIRKLEVGETENIEQEESIEDREKISESFEEKEISVEEEKIVKNVEIEVNEEGRTREKILSLLRKKEEGEDIDSLIMSIDAPVEIINNVVSSLIEEAEVYEPKPGRIRLL